ncbi:hypothetical protein RGR602_PB00406 (plasmid) [Rhizobium gallicum bv. gallicum R602sp]|uniref:Uncharacterized protein n=1 Tax=Rhizobium gallicum bv. gallicum R602sp TaxID=1041138 RepID=A0A0B4XBL6_9HYPH|nr:hypothetical protein RGR602_PB00406 [Rhizobium gallicum bv. gallicum R602sp]
MGLTPPLEGIDVPEWLRWNHERGPPMGARSFRNQGRIASEFARSDCLDGIAMHSRPG